MNWTLKDCRNREAKYRASIAKIPGAWVPQSDQDRAQLLALVDRMREALDSCADHAHVPAGDDRCDDCCPGCEADELLEEIDAGGAR